MWYDKKLCRIKISQAKKFHSKCKIIKLKTCEKSNKSNYITIAKATRFQKQIKIKTCQIKYIKLNMPPQLINIALKLNKYVVAIVAIFGKIFSNMILSVGVIPGDFALRGFPSVPSPFRGLPCNNTIF